MVARRSDAVPDGLALTSRSLTDPAVPMVLLSAAALLGTVAGPGLLWGGLGGVAGYSLSGSV